jgi:hypothetical protein
MPDSIRRATLEQATVISLEQRWEVTYWTREFGICEEQLRELLQRVGNRADNVRRYIETTGRGSAPVRYEGWQPARKA